jgi:hypothetical protein
VYNFVSLLHLMISDLTQEMYSYGKRSLGVGDDVSTPLLKIESGSHLLLSQCSFSLML